MYKYVLIFLVSILFLGCSQQENDPMRKDGDWDDVIQLSQRNVEFKSEASSLLITSEGKWEFEYITMPDNTIYRPNKRFGFDDTGNLGSYEWIELEKPTSKSLLIKVSENRGSARSLNILLSAGDCHNYIIVTQKGIK
ncbi:MAG: hypothetical protein ACLSIB_00035 [Parabacteroides merdae]|jgi:hypothetical protein